MVEEVNEDNSDELELAQKLLELTTYLEKNSSSIEKIEASITKWESKIQDLDLQIASKFTELSNKVNTDLKDLQNQVNNQIQASNDLIENEIKEQIQSNKNLIENEIKEQTQAHEDLKEFVQDQEVRIGKQAQEMEEKHANLTKQIENTSVELKTTISALTKHIRSQFESTTKESGILNDGITALNQTTNSHTDELEALRKGIKDCKSSLQDLISISKKDQKMHFENFSRMIESLNENIRTEITLSMQTLKESDIEILNEVSEHYMRKKAGEEIQKSVTNFYEEIQTQTTRLKDDLTESVHNSMQEYEKIIDAQSTSIQNYKEELERIQGEIQDIIDRKVNEKYEAVFSLLATVTMHAEELMMLVKTAEIHIPQETRKKIEKETQSNLDYDNS